MRRILISFLSTLVRPVGLQYSSASDLLLFWVQKMAQSISSSGQEVMKWNNEDIHLVAWRPGF